MGNQCCLVLESWCAFHDVGGYIPGIPECITYTWQTGTGDGNTLAPDDWSVGLPWPQGSPMRLGLGNDVCYKLWAGGPSLCTGYRSVLVLFGCNSTATGAPLALEPRVRGPSVTCPELLVSVSDSKCNLLKVSGCGFLHYQLEQASAGPWALSLLGMHDECA